MLDEDIKLAEGYAAMAAAETDAAPLRQVKASRQSKTGSIKRTATVSYKLSVFHQASDEHEDGAMKYARHYAEQRAQQGTSPQAEIAQEAIRILLYRLPFQTSCGPLELPPGRSVGHGRQPAAAASCVFRLSPHTGLGFKVLVTSKEALISNTRFAPYSSPPHPPLYQASSRRRRATTYPVSRGRPRPRLSARIRRAGSPCTQ